MKRYATFILILFLTVGLGACKWKKDDADAGATVITDDNVWDQNGSTPDGKDKGDAVCGNGKQEGAEVCDDGNTVSGDGCSAVCKKETKTETKPDAPACGNNKKEDGEKCDDGNTKDGDTCSADCKKETVAKLPDTKTQPPQSSTTTSVSIVTEEIKPAKLGEDYSFSIEAKCGSGTCKFEVTKDNDDLPAGIVLSADGKLSGKPSKSGKYIVAIKVSDGDAVETEKFDFLVTHSVAVKAKVDGFFDIVEKAADGFLDAKDFDQKAFEESAEGVVNSSGVLVVGVHPQDDRQWGYISFEVTDQDGPFTWKALVCNDEMKDCKDASGIEVGEGFDVNKQKKASYIGYIAPSSDQSEKVDFTVKNLKVVVKDQLGNEGAFGFKEIQFNHPVEQVVTNSPQQCVTPKKVVITTGDGKALKLGEGGANEITIGKVFKGMVGLDGGKVKSVQFKDEKIEGCVKAAFKDAWKAKEGAFERSFEPVTLNTCSGSLMTDVVTVSVTDADCNTTQDVTLELVVQYPDVLTTPVSEITKMWLEYETEWTNDETLVSVRLVNRHGGSCASADIIGTMVNAKAIGDEGKSDFNDEAVPFGLFDNVKGKDKKIQDIDALCVRIRDTSPASVEYTGNETADNIIGIGLSIITSGVHAGVAHGMDLVDMTMKFKGARVMTTYWYADIKHEMKKDAPGKDWVHMDAIDIQEATWKPRPNPGHATTP